MPTNNKNFHAAASELLPVVIKQADIPAITHVMIGDVQRYIGEVRDFRRNPLLSDFIPSEGRTSLSWVRLNADEVHQNHSHPTASMVIICGGSAELTGDTKQPVSAGDVVMIPPQTLHGFTSGTNGLWGISVQFEGKGLYEIDGKPRMELGDTTDRLRPFEEAQRAHAEQYEHNSLVELAHSDALRENTALQDSLLDVLQVWSDHFQSLIRIRAASTRDAEFAALADDHLKDEFGHNHILAEMRGNRPVHLWDTTLESTAAWFAERMAKGSDVETTIIMHLVIEESGDIFHKAGASAFPGSQHFHVHSQLDEDHSAMGMRILKERATEPVEQLIDTLNKGWAMMNMLCTRMAELAISRAHSPELYASPAHPKEKAKAGNLSEPVVGA